MKKIFILSLISSILLSSCVMWSESDYKLINESSYSVSIIDKESNNDTVYTLQSGETKTISHATNAQFYLTEGSKKTCPVNILNGYETTKIVDLRKYKFNAENLTSKKIKIQITNYEFFNEFLISEASVSPGSLQNQDIYLLNPKFVFYEFDETKADSTDKNNYTKKIDVTYSTSIVADKLHLSIELIR